MRTSLLTLVALVAVSTLDRARAQDPVVPGASLAAPVEALRPQRVPVHTQQRGPGEQPYGVWAAGAGYKASFHDGMTFVPYLGGGYPHNQPWSWRTQSVRFGEQELLSADESPERRDGDYRVEYQFARFTEAYDVLAEGLEQTFVLRQHPGGSGSLVITGRVTTALHANAPSAAHRPIVFADADGRELIGYGAATAIDANGNRLPMTTRWENGELRLELAADRVAAATFPLVVDPLLTRWQSYSITTVNGTLPGVESDLAHAEGTRTHPTLFAFTWQASANDSDLWVMAVAPEFWDARQMFFDGSTEDSRQPSCAYVAATAKWVVTWQALDAFGQHRIRVHLHGVDDLNQRTNAIGPIRPSGTHEWRPDVGGTVAGNSTQALIVFQRDVNGGTFADTATSTVFGLLFDTTTSSGSFGVPFQISATGNYDSERPSCNKQAEGGAQFGWLVVWQDYSNDIAGDDWDLVGRRVGHNGAVSSGSWASDLAAASRHQLGPVVEGRDGRYAVLFATCETQVGKTTSVLGRDVRVECLHWFQGAASPASSGNLAPVTLASNAQRGLQATGLAFDDETRSHWFVGWSEVAPLQPAARYARLGYRGRQVEGGTLYAQQSHVTGPVSAVYDRLVGDFRMLYCVIEPTRLRPYGQRCVPPTVTPASRSGTACGGAALDWAGAAVVRPEKNQIVGCDNSRLTATGTDSSDAHFVLMALATVNTPIVQPMVAPGCHLLVAASGPSYVGVLPVAIGLQASWAFPLPESLTSTTVWFQDWVYQPSSGLMRSSQRLEVQIAR